ncbi:helix-turn-helix domain-containing protein [Elizabethkingia miricola]|uniref:helix-turn-helix domain-containing protein n=1 Tax=Elizabethkingia miricola TaxID=172045 RepID=UPI0020111F08|nr:helix-turn-helix domain-containing protein [Elizabethkingia miricola]MCL1680600.1 helix-turn-helix domain-containing protein [Elizabethkingia miricola]
MNIFKYYLIFLLGYGMLYGQNKVESNSDTLKKYNFSELEDKFYYQKDNGNTKFSKLIAEYYLNKAKANKDLGHTAEGYVLMHYNESLSTSVKFIDSLQSIKIKSDDDIYPTRIYLLKGKLYYENDNQKLALENFVTALKYAKNKNNKRHIALAEIYIAYLKNYIGKHREAILILEYYYNHADYLTPNDQEHIRLNLADIYLDIDDYNSAIKLIQEGLDSTKKSNEITRYYRYLSLLGLYNLKVKNYEKAIDTLNKCKEYFLENKSFLDAGYSLFYLGSAYRETHQKEKAIESFIIIDSLVQKNNIIFPELREVYTNLIDYYKEKGDKENLLYFIERFIKVDEILDSQSRSLSKELPQKYDTPKLIKEKEEVINSLEKRKLIMNISLVVLVLILLLLTFLYYKSKKKQKKYKKIAQDLISSVEKKDMVTSDTKTIESLPDAPSEIIENESKTNKIISEDISSSILKELEIFETKELFLKKGITLSSLSKQIKTNTTYLSDVINTHKGKNFATYLNDLRIDYALDKLVKDKKFRSYKLVVIAEELGYNNEQAFAIAFKRKTGTTLSIYIKEIEKIVAL